jgi:hypothetical protein
MTHPDSILEVFPMILLAYMKISEIAVTICHLSFDAPRSFPESTGRGETTLTFTDELQPYSTVSMTVRSL